MRVFVTGATGFVGSAVVQDLLAHGHQVLGLSRNEANATTLTAAGATPHPGDLEDLASLRAGAQAADAVIHCGFIHDFSRFAEVCAIDAAAIEAMGQALEAQGPPNQNPALAKPFVVTSGTALAAPGRLATENDLPDNIPFPRRSEIVARALAARGLRAITLRLAPSVHGDRDRSGFIPILINLAREKGVSAYIGEGSNRWNAVHYLDAAPLYRLALESGTPGATYHAVGDEAIPFRQIAELIATRLSLPTASISPEQAPNHFGWFTHFAAIDCPASSQITRDSLNWQPTHPTLLADMESSTTYFKA